MEKYFAILIFLIFILSARSQKFVATQTTESLKKILIYKKDTQRVNILNQLSRPYLYSKHRQNNRAPALYYADEALTLARSLHYDKGIGNALLNKGILLMDQDYPNSLSSLQAALPFLKQTFDKYSLAVCFYNIGWCMHTFGENKKAILYYDSSLNLFEELKDTSAGAWVLAWTGHSHFDLGNYREAYETGEKARKWTNKSDTLLQTLTLAFLADLFLGAGLPEITVQYLPRILHFYPEMMDQKEVKVDWPLSWALERIGEAFLQLNQVDSALKIAQVLHIRFEKQDVTNHLFYGHVYAALGQYQNALPHFKKGYLLAKQNAQISLSSHANELGNTYLALKDFKKAIYYASEALDTAKKINALLEMKNAAGTLTNIYDQTKNYSKAYYYSKHPRIDVLAFCNN